MLFRSVGEVWEEVRRKNKGKKGEANNISIRGEEDKLDTGGVLIGMVENAGDKGCAEEEQVSAQDLGGEGLGFRI